MKRTIEDQTSRFNASEDGIRMNLMRRDMYIILKQTS
jgi:hypothetical protein